MRLCVFEDIAVSDLGPLTLTRAAFDLRCGTESLLQRQARFFAARTVGALVREEIEALCALSYPDLAVNDLNRGDGSSVVLVNARWFPPLSPPPDLVAPAVGLAGDQVAFVVLPGGACLDSSPGALRECLEEWQTSLPCLPAGGWMIDNVWDLIERNGEALRQDSLHWRATRRLAADVPGLTLVGPQEQLLIDPSARVEPFVLVDARQGPVLIDRDTTVEAFTRLEGPCYVGPGTHLFGGRLSGASIGPHCRVGGEVEMSILHGYSNKRHDGFLGHSYVGEWVNLGAGTQTSDLRNDYETIRMQRAAGQTDTGRIKIGAFVGDHTRTGIGTLLNAGTVVGPFCQLLPSGSLLPRRIPAFSQFGHGRLVERTDLRQMLTTAARVMERRGCAWTPSHADSFFALYESTTRERRQLLREAEQRLLRRRV